MGSSRCLYFSVFMCKTGLFQQTIDEHNDIIAGDIITIQKQSDKMSFYSKFDRTLSYVLTELKRPDWPFQPDFVRCCFHTHCTVVALSSL